MAALVVGTAAGTFAGGYAAGLAGVGPLAKPKGIVWAGQRFETRTELEVWLAERGVSYVSWAKRHPAAAARLDG